jgi:hypothetical protein
MAVDVPKIVKQAVLDTLAADFKKYDPKQVMQDPDYNYNTPGKIKVFLTNFSTKHLPKTVTFDITQMDCAACMAFNVDQLIGAVTNACDVAGP